VDFSANTANRDLPVFAACGSISGVDRSIRRHPAALIRAPKHGEIRESAGLVPVDEGRSQVLQQIFRVPLPFKKYDQAIVPDFNDGAMENVAAVTFSERYLSRSRSKRNERRVLAETLLHEMAHMWFGDVVTMRWWNDLWLNESFATLCRPLRCARRTEFKESWQHFYSEYKGWAYFEDDMVTTHPIESEVEGVKDAFATFDGITYGKGASALKTAMGLYRDPKIFKRVCARTCTNLHSRMPR